MLVWMIAYPVIFAVLSLLAPARFARLKGALLLLGFGGNLVMNIIVCGRPLTYFHSWAGWGVDFSLKLAHFSSFILMCAAILTFLVALYTTVFAKGKAYAKPLYAGMLLTIAMVNGAVMANNLMVLLFFWEAILITMFGMIMFGGKEAYHTSVKALVIAGATDLCMMLGIGIAAHLAGTMDMDGVRLPIEGWGAVAFVLLVIGAISKAGSMPFHTWIPDAAKDAPTPFMPFLPGALEKLLGIYLLVRVTVDLFDFQHGSAMSLAMMILGACTILFAVMMALIQRDFKRLLSYHAVSQVGYMILGIGTGLPVGIIGGLFHMLNNAVYKCCLFLTAGAVERETGTTNLNVLGGLLKKMPVTFACFAVAAAAIAGVPMTNGFFSKELIFDGALESGVIFYIIAAIGAFFTPISFLKLGHAVFFGKATEATESAREVPWQMQAPMIAMAAACLALGFGQSFVVNRLLMPILGDHFPGAHVGGHTNWLLVGISVFLLLLACFDHYRGFKRTGRGVEAADHFHYAPGLHTVYNWAEKKYFDPYEQARGLIKGYANISLRINDAISWVYDAFIPRLVGGLSALVRRAHNGSQARYVIWVLAGVVLVTVLFLFA